MKNLVIALVFLVRALSAAAEDSPFWYFDDHHYYDPLIAGVRDPHLSALFLARGKRIAFQVSDDDPRTIWDIDVGGEMPIIGYEHGASSKGRMAKKGLGIGLWIPIDFHMVEDLSDNSGPIVNTDYRFGGMVKVQYGLSATTSVAGRIHFGHESTHLGDEFSIVGQREFPLTFERINVSWEYVDAGVLYENRGTEPHFGFRGGVTANIRGSYYETGPDSVTISPHPPVVPSHNRQDPYAGVDVFWEDLGKWDLYLSTEVRWRTIYDYHRPSRDTPEDRQASVNIIVGTKFNSASNAASPFLRFYRGVNPHGQFRNQKNYTEIGLGVRLIR